MEMKNQSDRSPPLKCRPARRVDSFLEVKDVKMSHAISCISIFQRGKNFFERPCYYGVCYTVPIDFGSCHALRRTRIHVLSSNNVVKRAKAVLRYFLNFSECSHVFFNYSTVLVAVSQSEVGSFVNCMNRACFSPSALATRGKNANFMLYDN